MFGDTQVHLKGKFLYCWPYKWEDQVNWELIHKLTDAVTDWVGAVLPGVSAAIIPGSVESSVIWCVFCGPSYWRHNSLKDSGAYAKLLLYCKFIHTLFLLDDETEAAIGNNGYATFVGNVGRIVDNVLRYEVPRAGLKMHELFNCVNETSEFAGDILTLLVDIAEDMKTNFAPTKDSVNYLAEMSAKT
ncbi:unnamed protein product, partial [Allacma fusca]